MKKLATALTLILTSYGAWSGTNLLDLLKAGKAKYSTVGCQKFLQKADHTTLKSAELKRLAVPLKNFKYLDDYFFHYTNAPIVADALQSKISDRIAAQKVIIAKGGYKSIMEYQMTYSDALSNVKGVGFYVAANPFSSTSYGDTQLALRFSQNANILDVTTKNTEVAKVLAEKIKAIPEFYGCGADLQFSLLMNENGIDVALYENSSEWLVVFNEDIIVQSRVTKLSAKSNISIMQTMIANGDSAALVEYITEMGMTNSYRIPLASFTNLVPAGQKIQGKSPLMTVAGYIKNWNDSSKISFARVISSKKNPELQSLMSEFKTAKLITDDVYFKIPLAQTSEDFMGSIVAKIKAAPLLAKNWGELYNDNMTLLYKKQKVDLAFYLSNFPTADKRAEFYDSYTSKGFSGDQLVQIIDSMLKTDPIYFQKKDQEAKYGFFNTYFRYAKADKIAAFTATIDRLGYDGDSSFKRIASRPASYGVNGISFLSAYIKLKKNPALLTDSLISTLASNAEFNSIDFMIYLKQNQVVFGAASSKFTSYSLAVVDLSFIDGLIRADYAKLFSSQEKDIILKRLLSDDVNGSKLIPKFVSMFAYSTAALSSALAGIAQGLGGNGDSLVAVIKLIEVNPVEWTKFSDLSNPQGMISILSSTKLSNAVSYLVGKTADAILRNPAQINLLPASARRFFLTSQRVTPYFSSYTNEQKLAVSLLMVQSSVPGANQLLAQIVYTPAMVASNADSLINTASEASDFESLLNNTSFVGSLSLSQFETLVSKAIRIKQPLDLKGLIRSSSFDLDHALKLTFKLERANGQENMTEISDNTLNFDSLSDSDKAKVVSAYLQNFPSNSNLSKSTLWKRVFDYSVNKKTAADFLRYLDTLSGSQKSDLLAYFTSSESLMTEAISKISGGEQAFYEAVIAADSSASLSPLLAHIESHYPVAVPYYASMIKGLDSGLDTYSIQKTHLEQFTCKKVNKFNAFNELIDNEKDKEAKKLLKDKRKQICESR